MAWNDGLEGQPLAIASSDESRIRVIAGPGSGKTYCLMRRIARLLESGIDPSRILLVTFTRTAAHDLQNNLRSLGVPGSDDINAGTLHSFCFRTLNREAVFQQTGRTPRPLFNFEREFLIRDLMNQLGRGKRQVEASLKALEAGWARLQSDEAGWPQDSEDRTFLTAAVSYLRFHEAMLIEEVIPETLKYLRNNGAADELTAFDYVFVDEYQDLNKAEQSLMNLVASQGSKMVIGDEDQSIYENFRNAHPEGIRQFHEAHPGTVDFPLEQCRRCPTDLVAAADSLIQNNQNREPRNLQPRPENCVGSIHVVQWANFDAERDGIVRFVTQRIAEGVPPGKILVMSPRRDLGNNVRDALQTAGIEAHSFFTEEIFESPQSQKSMTLLNLLVNRNDRVALRTGLGLDVVSGNCAGYRRVQKYCEDSGESPYEVIEKLQSGALNLPYTDTIVRQFEGLKAQLDEYSGLTPQEVIQVLYPPSASWTFPFVELWSGDENVEDMMLDDYRKLITNQAINPVMPIDVDYVRIMSIHKSKGLTARVSIILSTVQGMIPRLFRDLPASKIANLGEEQRRLFFVGITRHTEELVISTVRYIPKTIAYGLNIPVPRTRSDTTLAVASDFIAEMGNHVPKAVNGKNWMP
jgi:DNA helicase-2/ATP-dependent DNA helicase PcrA